MNRREFFAMLERAEQPQHVGAVCPDCKMGHGVPSCMDGRSGAVALSLLTCAACGHGLHGEWEACATDVALAWYGLGAAHQERSRNPDLRDLDE